MERWAGRVAVVTGASAGIGASIAEELAKNGLKVVGLARRVERVEEVARTLTSAKGELHSFKCDITKEEEVKEAFQWLKKHLGGVDILINNAGIACLNHSLTDGPSEDWRKILDLNVFALSVCTRETIQIMKEKGVDDGHIIHINSDLGHFPPGGFISMYCASKHAVTALTEALRKELVNQKSKIRVTSLSPGLVKTEMPSEEILTTLPCMNPEDISNAVLYVLGTPPHVQVHELTILPVGSGSAKY